MAFPKFFHAAFKWPRCKDSINYIDDQLRLGSCLPVSLSHMLADRFCIASHGRIQISLSSWDMITCCPGNTQNLGIASCLWENGIRTGGSSSQQDSGCNPYAAERCSEENIKAKKDCQASGSFGMCTLKCYGDLDYKCGRCSNNGSAGIEASTKFYAKHEVYTNGMYLRGDNSRAMMKEIMTNGPVVILVNEISNYTGGIITYANDNGESYHAVRVVGWGTENDVDYWLIANSYGDSFGEKGFVKVARQLEPSGLDDIARRPAEQIFMSVQPDLERLPLKLKFGGYRMNLNRRI